MLEIGDWLVWDSVGLREMRGRSIWNLEYSAVLFAAYTHIFIHQHTHHIRIAYTYSARPLPDPPTGAGGIPVRERAKGLILTVAMLSAPTPSTWPVLTPLWPYYVCVRMILLPIELDDPK